MRIARQLKEPLVTGSWVVEGPAATVLVRANPRGVVETKFITRAEARKVSGQEWARDAIPWMPDLLQALADYLAGRAVSFDEFPIDLREQPPFRRKVQETCRRIAYGKTVSYAGLAARAGNAAAVRAVGGAMSHNPVPILIPCHRVVRSDGGLGGFSAPDGVNMKQRLLDMERQAAKK